MITKIELHNFQSHKNTVLEFDKGINSICGESDNGKSAVIRAIRWVLENRPSGIDSLNSNWNDKFKNPMSVKIYTEKGYCERIRSKDRNGYDISTNGEIKHLDAIGKDVPSEVTEFFNFSDVNVQYQFDQPYMLSMSGGKSSEYLNKIVHLDSIDDCMTVADSDKRKLSSEQKIVENDIKSLEEKVEREKWVEHASKYIAKIDEFDENIKKNENQVALLQDSITKYKGYCSEIKDVSEQKKLIDEIESVEIQDTSDLQNQISRWKIENQTWRECIKLKKQLNAQLPDTCPYCNQPLNKDCLCS